MLNSVAKQHAAPRRNRISDQEAKKRIKALFEDKHGHTVYPSDVADELKIDYERVLQLITELEADGKVARV